MLNVALVCGSRLSAWCYLWRVVPVVRVCVYVCVPSYRMRYFGTNVTDMYSLDVSECGRPPNYFSTTALEWFCLYYGENFDGPTGSVCSSFATCSLFGSCKPIAVDAAAVDVEQMPARAPSSPFVSLFAGKPAPL